LRGAQFDARRSRRNRDSDVAGNGDADGSKLRGVGVAYGSHLHRPALGKIRRCRIHSIGGNRAGLRRTTGDAVDTPDHAGVRGVRDAGRECECFTEQHRARIGSHDDLDGGRWGRRGRYGACASPAAAQSPRTHREENADQGKSAHFWRSNPLRRVPHGSPCFSSLRKGPHAFCNCRRRTSEIALHQFSCAARKGTAKRLLTSLDRCIWNS